MGTQGRYGIILGMGTSFVKIEGFVTRKARTCGFF